MASIVQKLETKGVIMTLLSLVLISTGCEEQIDSPAVNSSGEKTVEVTLNIGFANEADGYTLATKSGASADKGAFSYELQPSVITKGNAVKPNQLYNLEIQQYDRSGKRVGGMSNAVTQAIGSAITLTLSANTDCQLVLVAWGEGNTSIRLGTTNTLEAVQKLSVDASDINSIPTTNMNKMPYALHLEHVCVEGNTIKSTEGKDVRLLLKRLAARLTLNWTYSYSNYTLNKILLESIPTNYNVIPKPDETDKTYPSLFDLFTTIQIDPSGKSSYSCWIPANVRGMNPAATSQNYRIKSNAPTGSSYASFIAVNNNGDSMKKLNYRVYLGGSTTFDFNIYSNTDYNYTVNFKHIALPVNDRRVTIIDPIPASENNNNLLPTANCFMVAPGGSFCFDPFKYQIKGNNNTNSTLKEWASSNGGIAYVKLLWQTKENGDVGDPVMGVVNSADDHTNIVDIKRIDNKEISSNPVTDVNQAYIYCRVAPNTTGGSGAIAAYNTSGQILWSWHIWVTEYHPDATGNENVQTPNKRKQKYSRADLDPQLPMMDRNLGAMAGYTTVPETEQERSKANGFHYQWGRKDPFRSSYSNKKLSAIEAAAIDKPIEGILSLYKEDGVTFFPMSTIASRVNYQTAYQSPQNMYKEGGSIATWINDLNLDEYTYSWGMDKDKGLHDPCPAGWRVCSYKNYYPLFTSTSYYPGTINLKNTSLSTDGGMVIGYNNTNSSLSTYFRLTGYWYKSTQFNFIGVSCLLWCRDKITTADGKGGYHLRFDISGNTLSTRLFGSGGWEQEALLVRCIQERE